MINLAQVEVDINECLRDTAKNLFTKFESDQQTYLSYHSLEGEKERQFQLNVR